MTGAKLNYRRWSGDSGQALIETALSMSLLIALLLGVAEMGQLAYAAIEVANAARAGNAYATQAGCFALDTTGIQTAAQNDAPDLSGLTATSSHSCVCSDGTSSTCANTDCSTSHIVETVTVKTQATINPIIHAPGLPSTFTLKGQAVQKCIP
jgi:Flp pilus assembly protein TadG